MPHRIQGVGPADRLRPLARSDGKRRNRRAGGFGRGQAGPCPVGVAAAQIAEAPLRGARDVLVVTALPGDFSSPAPLRNIPLH